MKIGELAQAARCSVETIRYYEKEGLLPVPGRTTGNYRCYDGAHLTRLRFIRNCRALDMTHEEVRALLELADQPAASCRVADQLVQEHMAHVDVRIAELLQLRQQLGVLRHRCRRENTVEDCGILQELATMEMAPRSDRHTHLG